MESNDPRALRDLEKHLEDFTKELENRARLTSSTEEFIKSVRSKVSGEPEDLTQKKIIRLMTTLEEKSSSLSSQVHFRDVGTVQQIGNGVATVSGLPKVSIDEIVTFPTGVEGMALNLEQKRVDLIMLGSDKGIRGGDLVQATGNRLRIPVGSAFLGRVIDPLGNPLVKDNPIEVSEYRYLSRMAHGVIERSPVNESLFTGTKLIDVLFPIGRGQRELILGDRQTGKTTLAIDAILSQRHSDVRCIYVAIGQKKSSTLSVIQTLRNHDMLDRTAVIISSPDDQPALRYLAPYAGMTLAEYFLDQGMDVLVVFDDLTKHADAYRELSLLLRRPPGREAYPGDIFYLHSRLLERACKLDQSQGGGSITALPIATTQNGNISGYIPTNLISITDGQIVLDTNLFNQGQKPAIDIGRSVSRVGGAAQKPAIRSLVGDLKLELSQYQEVEHFTRFGTEVDEATRKQIKKGQRILAVLKQKPHEPISFAGTVVILYALNHGYLDRIPIRQMAKFKTNIASHFTEHETKLMSEIEKEGELTDPIKEQLTRALDFFTQAWLEEKGANQ